LAFLETLREVRAPQRDVQLGSLLTGLMIRAVGVDAIAALFDAAFELDAFEPARRRRVETRGRAPLVGVAGSGKKGEKTFNISTSAVLVASACGAYVLKPVARAASSTTGSADVLEALGVRLDVPLDEALDILRELGVGFIPIEGILPRFDAVYGRRLFIPNPFSFGLAGLACPVFYDRLLFGLSHRDVELAARVLARFGQGDATVVTTTSDGVHYIDEIGVEGRTWIAQSRSGVVEPARSRRPCYDLVGREFSTGEISQRETKHGSARAVVDVLLGRACGAPEEVVCLNAAHILTLSGVAPDIQVGYRLAKSAIRTMACAEKLVSLIKRTGGSLDRVSAFMRGR
jgi:anthranilate phosphoribosyltransferase